MALGGERFEEYADRVDGLIEAQESDEGLTPSLTPEQKQAQLDKLQELERTIRRVQRKRRHTTK